MYQNTKQFSTLSMAPGSFHSLLFVLRNKNERSTVGRVKSFQVFSGAILVERVSIKHAEIANRVLSSRQFMQTSASSVGRNQGKDITFCRSLFPFSWTEACGFVNSSRATSTLLLSVATRPCEVS